ncbi:probable tRNA (guanine(26)-N(2))-dimethyltransferase 1 [Solanum verrucosum]|uniref:probable tRNA (guanine(26)-N(2))-dimethyltransferase 1 n=1 Tax=Solanum verrucosum TaxID=315347 RepID=UPI0020D11A84|nr:probable tRNA (guanine(26)-N(2))-dimethyltransferase 1 [Solanum verrucosum]
MEHSMSSEEEIGDEEKQLKNTSFDLKDYTIIKEGEAEILMHATNQVFYNKTQVNNRDMSIAVLRTFISQRKLEHKAMLARQAKACPKVPDESVSEMEPPADSSQHNGMSSDGCKLLEEMSQDEQCSISDVQTRNLRRKDLELKPARVLEALSASGLRALRYAREVEGIGQVVALDNDKVSVESCRRNIRFNGSVACSKLESHLADARVYMLTHPKEFDVVDLDPYGSPSVFLDSAVQSVVDGGILMCTATDLAVLCGGNGEVCYSKYGSYPLRGKYCHEMALRILLACIESHANRYKRYIVPVLSVHMDFYVRVFVRIYSSASAMRNTPLKLSYVYQCNGCDSFHLQPVGRTISKSNTLRYHPGFGPAISQDCSDCGKKFNMGGPIWSAPIHDQEWVAAILADVKSMKEQYPAYDRICAMLTAVSEELPDIPLFLSLHNISATLKCTSPSAVMFRSAVINAGYRTSGTHVNPLGLKTDAPMHTIWDIMRCWVKNHPVKAQPSHHPGTVILSKEPVLQANFARAVESPNKGKDKKVARFLPNPERHWGPKLRAGRQITGKHVSLLGTKEVNIFSNPEDSDNSAAVFRRRKATRKIQKVKPFWPLSPWCCLFTKQIGNEGSSRLSPLVTRRSPFTTLACRQAEDSENACRNWEVDILSVSVF